MFRIVKRFPPIDVLETFYAEAGLTECAAEVVLDEVLQGEAYLDPRGPLCEVWRSGDSTWSLAARDELAAAVSRTSSMLSDGSMDEFLAQGEKRRRSLGQATFVIGRKPPLP